MFENIKMFTRDFEPWDFENIIIGQIKSHDFKAVTPKKKFI
jgi:hypothetical protein